jgi:hypothetical protein
MPVAIETCLILWFAAYTAYLVFLMFIVDLNYSASCKIPFGLQYHLIHLICSFLFHNHFFIHNHLILFIEPVPLFIFSFTALFGWTFLFSIQFQICNSICDSWFIAPVPHFISDCSTICVVPVFLFSSRLIPDLQHQVRFC